MNPNRYLHNHHTDNSTLSLSSGNFQICWVFYIGSMYKEVIDLKERGGQPLIFNEMGDSEKLVACNILNC